MTTEIQGTVVLGFGPQAIDWISKASKLCGKDAVMDPDVARMAGATMAAGAPEALDALRQRLEPGALQAAPGISEAATRWLAHGERGLSSNSMFEHLTGISSLEDHWRNFGPHTPRDPADLRRCRLLLEQVPELEPQFRERMASASKKWAGLVHYWDAICSTMDEETPDWRTGGGRASKTYEAMKAIGL